MQRSTRRPVLPEARVMIPVRMTEYTIGVDLGGTNLRAAAIDRDGKMLDKLAEGTNPAQGREVVLGDMAALINKVRANRPGDTLAGIGVGVPGFILLEQGVITNSNNLACLENFPIRDEI